MKNTLLIFLVTSLLSLESTACSCIPSGKIGEYVYSEYSSIVLGKIVDIHFQGQDSLYHFIHVAVEEDFHGNNSDTIVIKAAYQAGMCAIWPEIGDQWLLFAKGEKKNLWTSSCFRTKSLNPKYYNYNQLKKELRRDLKFLRRK